MSAEGDDVRETVGGDDEAWSSSLVGVGTARADAVLPNAEFSAAIVRWNHADLWIERDAERSLTVPRNELARGWFVPAFTERALGLAIAGEERPVVTTANFAAWLVLETRDGRWIALSTSERERAYALLDALSIGPATTSPRWTLFGLTTAQPALRWPPSRTVFARTSVGTIASTAVADAVIAYAGAWIALAVVTGTAAAAIVWGQRAFRQRISSLSVSCERRRATIESATIDRFDLDLRKLEGVRFTRSGFVIEHEDAPRPIVVDIIDRDTAARAVEGVEAALDKLRVAHTFADWALRVREQSR